jgi:hypothetical protein
LNPALMLVWIFIFILLWVGFRCRQKQADRPRLREWKESHDSLLLHPANAVLKLQEGYAKRSR